jgi:hypothetical protein
MRTSPWSYRGGEFAVRGLNNSFIPVGRSSVRVNRGGRTNLGRTGGGTLGMSSREGKTSDRSGKSREAELVEMLVRLLHFCREELIPSSCAKEVSIRRSQAGGTKKGAEAGTETRCAPRTLMGREKGWVSGSL